MLMNYKIILRVADEPVVKQSALSVPTLPTAGYCKGSPCNEKRNLISMNWIFYAKLVNRMKQESVRLLLHPIHLH